MRRTCCGFRRSIETLIAMSVFYMALENIVVRASRKARWIITFLFGLVHGFGFSFGLQHTLQFAGSHLLTSLLSFNVGVELGQLLVLALLVPLSQHPLPLRRRRAHGNDHPVGRSSATRRGTGRTRTARSFQPPRYFAIPAYRTARLRNATSSGATLLLPSDDGCASQPSPVA